VATRSARATDRQQEERCCDGYNADGQDWIKRRASRFRARYQWLDRLAAVG